MTATLPDVAAKRKQAEESAEQQAAAELVRLAKERGVSLTGPDGLLKQLTYPWLATLQGPQPRAATMEHGLRCATRPA